MAMRDATEYVFGTTGRRVLVRRAQDDAELAETGRKYAEELETVMGATEVHQEPGALKDSGAQTVVVTARLPAAAGSGQPDTIVRTAFLRFGAGPAAELTMNARVDDQGAEGEFRRLLQTAKPAATSDPVREVARAVEAGPVGRPGYPAGPILLQLTPDYHGPESFTLMSEDRSNRVRLGKVSAETDAVAQRAAVEGTILGAGVGVAVDEEGRPVRYESGVRPRLYSRRRGAPETAAIPSSITRGGEAQAAQPGEAVVEGVVRGKKVRLRLERSSDDPKFDPKALGGEILRALNEPD